MERFPSLVLRSAILSRKIRQVTYSVSCLTSEISRQKSWPVYRSDGLPYLRTKSCPFCQSIHKHFLHSSSILETGKKAGKKKTKNGTNFLKKFKSSDEPPVLIKENMTIGELARRLNKDVDHVFEALSLMGVRIRRQKDDYNQEIHQIEDIREICRLSGRKTIREGKDKPKEIENLDVVKQPPPDPKVLVKRPPVVTIMGHVDHGKTTLLDALRHSNIVEKEFGGITQHIGAFSVKLESGDAITFLDTPGHAAFSAMRSRGAHVTDIVVLVIAADDGVMEQTVQSINFAQDAKVPIIVAINKCDKPNADIDTVKRGLLGVSLTPEDLGGDIQCIPISALKRKNLNELQEAILVLSEIMELKGDPQGLVEAVVIESKVDQGKGKVSTVLVQRGTLKKGKILVAGSALAKVKTLSNEDGKSVNAAGPGTAVEIIGWRDLPHPGEEILEVESEMRAREVIRWRENQAKEEKMAQDKIVIEQKMEEHEANYKRRRELRLAKGFSRSSLFRSERRSGETVKTTTGPELCIIIRGDVDGSVEAILDTIGTYDSHQCHLEVLNCDVGAVTEQDVETAATFNGIIYAFNTKVPPKVAQLARIKNVPIKEHNVIYQMIDDLREELTERLEPLEEEHISGEASVVEMFMININKKDIPVAGCRCTKGILNRKKKFKLVRNDETLVDGTLLSLRHFKNEVDTVKTDVECGLRFDDSSVEPQRGDTIICYETVLKPQQLQWNLNF